MQQPPPLETLRRKALLATTQKLLAEADALSSRISVLNEIGLAMNQSFDLARIERVIAKQAKWLLDFAHCSVCQQEGERWRINTLFGTAEPDYFDSNTMPNLGAAMNTPRPQLIREGMVSAFLSAYPSQLIIPLSADNVFLGTINFGAKTPNRYTMDDMRIGYMLSMQLSSAIRNAQVVNELKATREELRLRVEELDAFAHTIAHDLKSPLGNILLRSQFVTYRFRDQMPTEAIEMLSSVEDSTQLMGRMIDQLLMLTKLRHTDQNVISVNARYMVEAAFKRFSHLIEANRITITIADNLPDCAGQTQWVEEVFANLISNAIKYMGENNPAPAIAIDGQRTGEVIRYTVKDNGVGIKPEDQSRLFAMFSRLHDVKGVEGLGLGLSIVRRIIKKLRGEIGVDSVYGQGSTFWFSLPIAQDLPEDDRS
jgi:signal transduction histidine kinase